VGNGIKLNKFIDEDRIRVKERRNKDSLVKLMHIWKYEEDGAIQIVFQSRGCIWKLGSELAKTDIRYSALKYDLGFY
jgi:hypothetical protein